MAKKYKYIGTGGGDVWIAHRSTPIQLNEDTSQAELKLLFALNDIRVALDEQQEEVKPIKSSKGKSVLKGSTEHTTD